MASATSSGWRRGSRCPARGISTSSACGILSASWRAASTGTIDVTRADDHGRRHVERRQARFEPGQVTDQAPLLDRERAQRGAPAEGVADRLQMLVRQVQPARDQPPGGAGPQRERRDADEERAAEVPDDGRRESAIDRVERGDVRRRCDEHEPGDAVRVVDGEPARDRSAETVADDRGSVDAGRVERVDRRPRVAGEVPRAQGAVPSRSINRNRARAAAERGDDPIPVARGAGLAVKEQGRAR